MTRRTPKISRICLDYASLTPVDPEVVREMVHFSGNKYANPSSLYTEGVETKKALENARKVTADFLNAHSNEIIFTSGGTESNAMALEATGRTAHRNGFEKPHVIVSLVEHSSIMSQVSMLEKHGVEVTRLPVDSNGIVSLSELKKTIKASTYLVSIMTVNNETGTIQPIRDMAKIIRDARKKFENEKTHKEFKYPIFHTDAAQAGLLGLNVAELGVDLMTLDSGKVYGPRGVGALYIKRGTPIEPLIYGGGQEKNLRSGTENLPGICGFAKALEIFKKEQKSEFVRLANLRQFFLGELRKIEPTIKVNGLLTVNGQMRVNDLLSVNDRHGATSGFDESATLTKNSSPHILNVSFPGKDSEFFMLQLDAKGVAVSTKSSCLRDEDESYVLKAMGKDSKSSVRFSFGRWTKKADLIKALTIIKALQKSN